MRKVNEAKKNNIKIISQTEFLKMLRIKNDLWAIFFLFYSNILKFLKKLINDN